MSPPTLTRRLVRAGYAAVAALTLTAGVMAAPANAATHTTTAKAKATSTTRTLTPKARSHLSAPTRSVCAKPTRLGEMACLSLVRTDVKGHKGISPLVTPSGYGPSDLQSAYALPSSTNGSGQTVAIVDAQDDPNAAADLTTYRSQYGLPACTTASGCFRKVDENGGTSYPSPDSGWAEEESLDLDMVSAVCPNCHILLVEATSANTSDLGTAVNEAVALGAKYVSNSYGGSEDPSDTSSDSSYYNHPGVAVTASSGDSGYGVEYPAASQYVTAVGGTSLSQGGGGSRGWTETAWSGAGSGCSAYDPKPSWQKDTGCSKRTVADVSAVADPNTGVAVYDSYQTSGWVEVGGTSVSSPITASVFALAGTPAAGTYPSSYPYAHTGNLNDVTSGSNGSCSPSYLCTAGPGYDGPTGLGTPNGVAAFTNGGTTGNTVTVTNPGNQTTTTGSAVSLQMKATDSASGQTLTYSATGLPTGLSISSSGLITGTASTAGTYNVTVTAKDGTGASGSTSFTWTVSSSGGGCSSPGNKVGNGGFESGTAPWTTTAGVINANGSGETSHSGSYFAWFDGYGTTHTDTASQSVTIPAGCKASLTFWLHIDTAETSTTTAYDTFTVKVGSTTVATFSNLNANTGYTQHTYDVSANAGQTVTLLFTGKEDASLQTSFVLDDVAINAS